MTGEAAEQITVRLTALSFSNESIGTIKEGAPEKIGKKAFVKNTVPGELIRAKIVKEEKSLVKAELLEIIESSPSRAEPRCEIFLSCGGCDYQHIEIGKQRALKEEMALSMLKRHGGISPCRTYFLSDNSMPYGYRRRISLHLDREGRLGFYRSGSSQVVELKVCHIASNALNGAIDSLRPFLKILAPIISGIVIEENRGNIFIVAELRTRVKPDFSAELLANFSSFSARYKNEIIFTTEDSSYPAGHFSQVNPEGNELLIKTVKNLVTADEVTDLYAGYGNLSLPLARDGKRVDAVEVDSALVRYGKSVTSDGELKGEVTFYEMSCERFFATHSARQSVILDPPRSGAKTILKYLFNSEEIIYVSCNLPSFCRDLKLLAAENLILEELYLIDMFPQTHHIELVGQIKRKPMNR